MPKPCDILGITGPNSLWKLQYGLPGVAGIKELSQTQLSNGDDVPGYFQISVDGKWVRVRVPVDAGTTSGSEYPRDELRQMTAAGKEAAWDSSKLDCWFEYELCPVHLPAAKPQMCVFQLHSDKDDLYELIWQRNSAGGFEFTQRVGGTSKGQPVIPHADGLSLVLGFGLVKGVATAYRDGKPILTTSKMPQSKLTYAKLLNYLQSNAKTDKVGEYGEILARNVRTGLGAYPGLSTTTLPPVVVPDPTPVPVPDPVPVPSSAVPIIMFIRHAEGGTNAHTLDSSGLKRAIAIGGLFSDNPIRQGLYRPDRLIVSEGKTASLRPFQTLAPLSAILHEPEITAFAAADYKKLAKALPGYGGVTLVCWAHTELPKILKAMKIKTPTTWPDARYDVVWILTGDGKGGWAFSQQPEMIMPGDLSSVLK